MHAKREIFPAGRGEKRRDPSCRIASIFNAARRENIIFALPHPYVRAPFPVPFWLSGLFPEGGFDAEAPGYEAAHAVARKIEDCGELPEKQGLGAL